MIFLYCVITILITRKLEVIFYYRLTTHIIVVNAKRRPFLCLWFMMNEFFNDSERAVSEKIIKELKTRCENFLELELKCHSSEVLKSFLS
jgi:hypothetical protein